MPENQTTVWPSSADWPTIWTPWYPAPEPQAATSSYRVVMKRHGIREGRIVMTETRHVA